MKAREIKIGYDLRQSKKRTYPKPQPTAYPKIILSGKWLKAAGIEIGETAEVIVNEGFIVIKPC
jgi:hypothetical protein